MLVNGGYDVTNITWGKSKLYEDDTVWNKVYFVKKLDSTYEIAYVIYKR